ncbi:Complement C1q-like protein 3 [Mizuhopecten yessoensis]|uniref:Complement C1q-like protein 3 n=1 Tax=Mizuhopecten yessoensis TaxID=6573 RepID=A0A210QXL9_MIZYE|nr:Complement C1q-like protein 3 [Mizuhopecten yessoensis]
MCFRVLSKKHNNHFLPGPPPEDIVAFHAILAHTLFDPSTNHVVVFDKLVTNSGGVHYSPTTDILTCTQSGIHVFSWAIAVPSRQYIYTALVRNNAVIGSAVSGQDTNYYNAASTTAATYLGVGDEVWVRAGQIWRLPSKYVLVRDISFAELTLIRMQNNPYHGK